MPTFPNYLHSYESRAEPIENVTVELAESGKPMAYLTANKPWFKVTLINVAYHDITGGVADSIDAFYLANQLQENISFECKGYRYVGMMLSRPQVESLGGFGLWRVTTQWQAQRVDKSVATVGVILPSSGTIPAAQLEALNERVAALESRVETDETVEVVIDDYEVSYEQARGEL